MQTGIYAILNFVSNKIYVGQAFNIQKRWKNHRIGLRLDQHTNRYLQSAYNKDGQFSFIFYLLEECTIEELDVREQYWMDFYNSANREFGYNLSPTAGKSQLGFKHSPETIDAWSKQRKGKKRSEEAKAAIKAGWIKRKEAGPVSEETKRKLSESHTGYKASEQTKVTMSAKKIGNTNSAGSIRSQAHLDALREGRRKAARKREKDLMWT